MTTDPNCKPYVTGIWFSTRESDIPLITSMGRLHPLWVPMEEGEEPLSWDDAYHVETDTAEAIRTAIEEGVDTANQLIHEGELLGPREDYLPGLHIVRVLQDGHVVFSGIDFLEELRRRRESNLGTVLSDFETGKIDESDLRLILEEAVFPTEAFIADAEKIYDSHGAVVPDLTGSRTPDGP